MSRLDDVRVLPGRRRADGRGWLHVALGASQLPAGVTFGELYLVQASERGARRGDHFHPHMHELFSVVSGTADLELVDPVDGARRVLRLTPDPARTVHVPPGIAHCFVNASDAPLVVVAFASAEHDPADVVSFSTALSAE